MPECFLLTLAISLLSNLQNVEGQTCKNRCLLTQIAWSILRATKRILGQGFQVVPKRAELVAV